MIHIRRAGLFDTKAMAVILNELITIGGTTAHTRPVNSETLAQWMGAKRSAWFVAEDSSGKVLGFQWIESLDTFPKDHAAISTFVQYGKDGLGIGTKLFDESRKAALTLGYIAIEAIIRADNLGGLAYYQSRGFEDFKHLSNIRLDDGSQVDKIWKRYNLRA